MRQEYKTPELNLQHFMPNENVAACYYVHCPAHMDSNYNQYSHSKGNQYFGKSSAELLAAGITQEQLDNLKVNGASIGGHNLTIELGNDGVMYHSDVQLQWRENDTNFSS